MAKLMHITAVAAFIGLTELIVPAASADDDPKRPHHNHCGIPARRLD
jgi:hypothetical protein